MSVNSRRVKDIKYRYAYKKNEINLLNFKFLKNQVKLTLIQKHFINFIFFKKLDCNFCMLNRYRNRCLLSGKMRFVFSFFKLSRMMMKDLSLNGFLVGVSKACW